MNEQFNQVLAQRIIPVVAIHNAKDADPLADALNAQNVVDYLKFPKVAAVGGSWIVKSDAIAGGEFDKITQLTREAVEIVKNLYKLVSRGFK